MTRVLAALTRKKTVLTTQLRSIGYSVCAVDEATVEATDVYLASVPEPPAALRRLLNEGRDEVLRALRNQDRDHEAATLEK